MATVKASRVKITSTQAHGRPAMKRPPKPYMKSIKMREKTKKMNIAKVNLNQIKVQGGLKDTFRFHVSLPKTAEPAPPWLVENR